jgi:hypothetical protein
LSLAALQEKERRFIDHLPLGQFHALLLQLQFDFQRLQVEQLKQQIQ